MKQIEKVYSRILDFIAKRDNFLITTHQSADGDAYGSALAMAYFLSISEKSYQVILHDQEKEKKYNYLWGWNDIISYSQNWSQTYAAGIVLDVPSKGRIGNPSALLPPPEHCLKIDHHPVEEEFSDCNLIDPSASSTCHLVYEVISRSGITITHDLSNLLLTGIMYDTGRFSFSNTTQRDFEMAAQLIARGARPDQIATNLFFNNSFKGLKIIGYGLANMESYLDGQVCVIYLPLKIMQEARNLDIEELANYSIAVREAEVGLFIRHAEPDLVKVSFRSKGRVDVNKVAKIFGGGGHIHAAGCRAVENPDDLKRKIVTKIAEQL